MYRKMTRLAFGAKCGNPLTPGGTPPAEEGPGSPSHPSATAPRPSAVWPRNARRGREDQDWERSVVPVLFCVFLCFLWLFMALISRVRFAEVQQQAGCGRPRRQFNRVQVGGNGG